MEPEPLEEAPETIPETVVEEADVGEAGPEEDIEAMLLEELEAIMRGDTPDEEPAEGTPEEAPDALPPEDEAEPAPATEPDVVPEEDLDAPEEPVVTPEENFDAPVGR
jgi:hypothetical protein